MDQSSRNTQIESNAVPPPSLLRRLAEVGWSFPAPGMDCFRRSPSPHSPASRAVCGEAPVAGRAAVCRAAGTGPGTPRPHFHPDGGGRGDGPCRAAWRTGGVILLPVSRGRNHDACRTGGGPISRRLPSRLAGRSPTRRGGAGGGGGMETWEGPW